MFFLFFIVIPLLEVMLFITIGKYIGLWNTIIIIIITGIRRVENIYLQYKNGILQGDAFDRIGMGSYRGDYAKETWKDWKNEFDKDFIMFFEKLRDTKN